MKKPKMIMFDYGQTLVDEGRMNAVEGTREVLKYSKSNKYNLTAEEVQKFADEINFELGRTDPARRDEFMIEVPNHMFTSYLYKYLGIELALTPDEIDNVFWSASNYCIPTDGIVDFLEYLKTENIRTAVVSNISFCGESLKNKINNAIPTNNFEFIIASSEFIFRKPSEHIFELALRTAELYAEDVWFVGDNYKCDVLGASSVGMTSILYDGASTREDIRSDCLKITHWNELKEIINAAK